MAEYAIVALIAFTVARMKRNSAIPGDPQWFQALPSHFGADNHGHSTYPLSLLVGAVIAIDENHFSHQSSGLTLAHHGYTLSFQERVLPWQTAPESVPTKSRAISRPLPICCAASYPFPEHESRND